jgi:hypothetical protein
MLIALPGNSMEHAQDGRGIKRSAEMANELTFSMAERSRDLCA